MFAIPLRRIVALPLFASLALLGGCGPKAADQPATPTVYASDAAAVATDWTVENPTEPAVPVNLPSTHLTNAPVAVPSGSAEAPGGK